MFERIKSFFRKGAIKVLGTPELFKALDIEIPISPKMRDAIELWAAMHENRAPWVEEGKGKIRSLGIPALIVKEESRLTTIELNAKLSGSARADFLNVPFQQLLNQKEEIVDFACARGDMVLKPYISGNTIAVDQVKAGDHFSLAFDSNRYSTAELFLDWRVVEDKTYIRGEVQRFIDGNMEITNKIVVKHKNGANYYPASFSDVDDWANIAPYATIANVKQPLWGLFKMPFANTVDTSSPLGVSSFADSVTLIEDADRQYSNLLWEMDSGRRKVIVDETTIKRDKFGNPLPTADEFVMGIDAGDETLFADYSAAFRDASIINALHFILSRIEAASGLSQGAISKILQGQVRTATEVLSMDAETRGTVELIRTAFNTALEQLIYAMDVWATVANDEGYFKVPAGQVDSTIEFGDGVVISEDEEWNRGVTITSSGWLLPEILTGRYLGLPTKTPEDLAYIRANFMPGLADVD